jgi:hypothetical protein
MVTGKRHYLYCQSRFCNRKVERYGITTLCEKHLEQYDKDSKNMDLNAGKFEFKEFPGFKPEFQKKLNKKLEAFKDKKIQNGN